MSTFKFLISFCLMIVISSGIMLADDITSAATGNWSSTGTWEGDVVPGDGDNVTIADGHTVTIDQDVTINNLTIGGGSSGILQFTFASSTTAKSLTVNGLLTISNNGTFITTASSVSMTHTLTLKGNVSIGNNATFNMWQSSSKIVNTVFASTSASDQTITSGEVPALVRFCKIILNRGDAAYKVTTSLDANIGTGASGIADAFGTYQTAPLGTGTWEQTGGTFSIWGTSTLPIPTGITIKFSGSANLNFNNGTGGSLNIGSNASPTGSPGQLVWASSGTFNYSNGSKKITVHGDGILDVQSGTLNINGSLVIGGTVTSGCTPAKFFMSGGAINIDAQASANLSSSTMIFDINSASTAICSAGTITIVDPHSATGSGYALRIGGISGNIKNFTGSTIRFGDGESATTGSADQFDLSISTTDITLGNIVINNPSGTDRGVINLSTGTNTIAGDFTITAGSYTAHNATTHLGGNFTNNGTFTPGATTTISLNGTSAQSTGPTFPANLPNLILNNTEGITISNSVTVSGTLTLGGNGSYTNLDNVSGYTGLKYSATSAQSTGSELPSSLTDLVLNNPAGVTFNSSVTLSGMLTLGGNGSYTNLNNVSGYTGLTYSATIPQTTGSELGSSITNLNINNANGVTLGGSKSVTGTLTLTSGLLTLGTNNLVIGSAGSISGGSASSYIVTDGSGVLTREDVGASNVGFPVGTASSYNPVTINNAGTADDFSVKVKSTFDNPLADPNSIVNRQWTITEATPGESDATITLQWNSDEEASGFNRVSSISIAKYAGGAWFETGATLGGSDPYSATASNFTSFSDFAVGNESALPVQLASFGGSFISGNSVKLEWSTLSEINNLGFYVQKLNNNTNTFVTIDGSFQAGAGYTLEPQYYTWTDENAVGTEIQYRLKQVDNDGLEHYYGPITVTMNPTSVKDKEIPAVFKLDQNYPNPFNPTTFINYQLPISGYVTLKVYNILGNEVAALVDGYKEAGYHKVTFDGSGLSSGIYFYKLHSGNNVHVKKLTLMK